MYFWLYRIKYPNYFYRIHKGYFIKQLFLSDQKNKKIMKIIKQQRPTLLTEHD